MPFDIRYGVLYEYKTNSIIGYFYRADFIIVEKEKWRTNKLTNEIVYGYQCYNQVNNGSIKNRTRYGLDTEGYCDIYFKVKIACK